VRVAAAPIGSLMTCPRKGVRLRESRRCDDQTPLRRAAPSARPVAFSRATPSAAMYQTPPKRFLPATPAVHESVFQSRYLGRALDYPWFARTFGGWGSLRWTARGVWTEIRDHDLRAAIDAMPLPTRFSRWHADFPAALRTVEDNRHLHLIKRTGDPLQVERQSIGRLSPQSSERNSDHKGLHKHAVAFGEHFLARLLAAVPIPAKRMAMQRAEPQPIYV